jgi:iron only hydrogenase large subunit-like protein
MNVRKPIYTETTECQDCYKCVRVCPVKAIRVRDGHASVDGNACVYCGQCVSVCPNSAKKVRDDLPRARQLVAMKVPVYVSLAPSFVSEFPEWTPDQLVSAIYALGVTGVSETALGAEIVSAEIDRWFESGTAKIRVSTACPVVVDLITKQYPELVPCLGATPSPLLAHGAMLRERYGRDIAVIFVGPCIAKKCESDPTTTPIDVALSFQDLRRWFALEGIDPATVEGAPAPQFVPAESSEGRRYPLDGGMGETLRLAAEERFGQCVRASGLAGIRGILDGLGAPEKAQATTRAGTRRHQPTGSTATAVADADPPLFLELLACDGGCINGPCMSKSLSMLARRSSVLRFSRADEQAAVRSAQMGHHEETALPPRWYPDPATPIEVSDDAVREALRRVGKRTRKDELNCGGCGYDTCREFAKALVAGTAETAMCVAYMRRLAQKKSNALLKTMPSAVVTVDSNLCIVECNRNFARLCGHEAELVYDALPGMEGARLGDYLPQTELFAAVLHGCEDIQDKTIRIGSAIVNATLFSIEDHHMVGAILQDVTAPAMHRSQIVSKTNEVIEKNLATVQKIAYLLGENASETELILNSIRRSFGDAPEVN